MGPTMPCDAGAGESVVNGLYGMAKHGAVLGLSHHIPRGRYCRDAAQPSATQFNPAQRNATTVLAIGAAPLSLATNVPVGFVRIRLRRIRIRIRIPPPNRHHHQHDPNEFQLRKQDPRKNFWLAAAKEVRGNTRTIGAITVVNVATVANASANASVIASAIIANLDKIVVDLLGSGLLHEFFHRRGVVVERGRQGFHGTLPHECIVVAVAVGVVVQQEGFQELHPVERRQFLVPKFGRPPGQGVVLLHQEFRRELVPKGPVDPEHRQVVHGFPPPVVVPDGFERGVEPAEVAAHFLGVPVFLGVQQPGALVGGRRVDDFFVLVTVLLDDGDGPQDDGFPDPVGVPPDAGGTQDELAPGNLVVVQGSGVRVFVDALFAVGVGEAPSFREPGLLEVANDGFDLGCSGRRRGGIDHEKLRAWIAFDGIGRFGGVGLQAATATAMGGIRTAVWLPALGLAQERIQQGVGTVP
mmetsp:Transcript_25275/g.53807  ORF Transcript_25275/g.53807 Transcript_25275/m.53807 type:complete len:468 (+) Transcript_25275:1201-2604(+)